MFEQMQNHMESMSQGLLPNGEWLQSSDGSAQDQSVNVMGSYFKKKS